MLKTDNAYNVLCTAQERGESPKLAEVTEAYSAQELT